MLFSCINVDDIERLCTSKIKDFVDFCDLRLQRKFQEWTATKWLVIDWQFVNRNCYSFSRVSWALAQISCETSLSCNWVSWRVYRSSKATRNWPYTGTVRPILSVLQSIRRSRSLPSSRLVGVQSSDDDIVAQVAWRVRSTAVFLCGCCWGCSNVDWRPSTVVAAPCLGAE